ncbi:sialidase family protein [Brachyspira catarrhinii]|uniref:Exo-alpha-sialidase n=1 Tax=Brachyspira catarrhinii TaxID=2528966 RepID=A0ABY2TP04_9SPIR|nr:sialidase family protein [Brachyspira catarrhinii]TKZ30806.1 exo-alpha-sialidase [Brachyspira catarrhinii]
MRKQSTKTRLMVLATALLLVWVGISCKNNVRPAEGGGLDLSRPDDTTNIIGNPGGLLNDNELGNWNDKMIQIRLLAESDETSYKRNPVIATLDGDVTGSGIVTVFERRKVGTSGDRDVAINGSSLVELAYQYSPNGGNEFGNEGVIGEEATDPTLSRGAPVIFTSGKTVAVVAAAGSGFYGFREPYSQIKIIKGTASGYSINWEGWQELNITHGSYTGSEAIREYVKETMGANYNTVYLRSGQGQISGNIWVLTLSVVDFVENQHGYFGALVIYSDDGGVNWKFGPYKKHQGSTAVPWWPYDSSSDYREARGVLFDGTTVTAMAAPEAIGDSTPKPLALYKGTYSDTGEMTLTTTGILDATGGFELAKDTKNNTHYFINTRKRITSYNKILTIAEVSSDVNLIGAEMKMTGVSGVGSVAVLADGSIVTIAEEAFTLGSTARETKFNIVQRRFTPGYMKANSMIIGDERYFNPNYDIADMDN